MTTYIDNNTQEPFSPELERILWKCARRREEIRARYTAPTRDVAAHMEMRTRELIDRVGESKNPCEFLDYG